MKCLAFKNFKYLIIIVILFCFFSPIKSSLSHSLDVTSLSFVLPSENQGDKLPQTFDFELNISWLEVVYLIKGENDMNGEDYLDVFSHKDKVVDYINNNLTISSQSQECQLQYKQDTQNDLNILTTGMLFKGKVVCRDDPEKLFIKNSLFVADFPLQANIVSLFINDYNNLVDQIYLDKTDQQAVVTINGISISDYFTAQTDNNSNKQDSILKNVLGFLKIDSNQGNNSGLSQSLTDKFVEFSKISIWLAVLLVFILGFLHTMEAGHSKTILASLLIDNKITLKQGLSYSLVFTLTHIADIVLLGTILFVVNTMTDVYKLLPYLQIFSIYCLLFIALYLFVKNFVHFLKDRFNISHHHHHHHGSEIFKKFDNLDFKRQVLLGFITGLAPCLFGWSIFLLILSTGSVWSVIPVIIFFGLGIFMALVLLTLVIHKFKTKFFNRFKSLAKVSPIISALLLLIFAIAQII